MEPGNYGTRGPIGAMAPPLNSKKEKQNYKKKKI
jgi:hypothetical protein